MKYVLTLMLLFMATEAMAYTSCFRDYKTGEVLYCK